MNYKLVLKTYAQLRQLTDDETALLNTLRGMSESERELLAETLGPVVKAKSTKPATKRVIEKCVVEGCGLTRRAVVHKDVAAPGHHGFRSIPIKPTGQRRGMPSSPKEPRCVVCFEVRDHAEHDVANGGHEFTADLAGRVNETLDKHQLDGGVSKMRCAMENCGAYADDSIHHLTSHPTYHEFVGSETAVGVGGD